MALLTPILSIKCNFSPMILLQLSDRGGGIPRSKLDLLFQYMYSTAPQPSRSDSCSAPLVGIYLISLLLLSYFVLIIIVVAKV